MRLVVLIAVLFSTSVYGQDAKEIIQHYLDTVSNGDIDNWNKIKTKYTESEAYYSQNDFEKKIDFLHQDKPSFHRSFWVLPHHHKTELYNDSAFTELTSTFYFLKEKTIILLSNIPPMVREPFARDEFYSAHLPVQISKLMSKSKSVELVGIKEFPLEARLCYEIRMTTKGRTYLLFINTETFLIEYWNGREDEDFSILTKFSDYKKVGEFLIPMSEKAIKDGIIFYWENTRKYLINPEIDMEIFNYKSN